MTKDTRPQAFSIELNTRGATRVFKDLILVLFGLDNNAMLVS